MSGDDSAVTDGAPTNGAGDAAPTGNGDTSGNGNGGTSDNGNGNGNGNGVSGIDDEVRDYVESPIIMATVRVVAPFVFTFGLFIMFHGADSSGGGFQGGVIVATVMLMLGIAFGIDPLREWVGESVLVAILAFGVLAFLAIGVGTVALGGGFLEYHVIETELGIHHATKYGIEAVELAIGVIVASTITGLFFAIDAGKDGGDSA